MTKLDLRKELKYLYAPSAKKVEAVKVPRFQFAMIDGMIEKGKAHRVRRNSPKTWGALRHLVHAQVHVQTAQGPANRLSRDGTGGLVVDRERRVRYPQAG